MRSRLLSYAALVGIACCASAANAQLIYSFESPEVQPDGFFGLGATVTQDVIGATVGDHSLKYAVAGGTFVGARTETVVPAALNNPPGVKAVLFDMFIPEAFPNGSFANLGITVFGHNIPNGLFGLQAQFGDEEPIGGKAAGQYTDLRIDLVGATNPVTFAANQTFNDIFGPGADQLTVSSAFQFYINKTGATPVTVYIDNVRLVVPEPATGALFGLGALAVGMVVRRRR